MLEKHAPILTFPRVRGKEPYAACTQLRPPSNRHRCRQYCHVLTLQVR